MRACARYPHAHRQLEITRYAIQLLDVGDVLQKLRTPNNLVCYNCLKHSTLLPAGATTNFGPESFGPFGEVRRCLALQPLQFVISD